MKKMRLILVTILTIMTLAVLGTYQNQSASAKAKYTTTMPKSMRGTWYHWRKYGRKKYLDKFIIKKHSFSDEDGRYKLKKPLTKKQYKEAVKGFWELENERRHTKAYKVYKRSMKTYRAQVVRHYHHTWIFLKTSYDQPGANYHNSIRFTKANGYPELLDEPSIYGNELLFHYMKPDVYVKSPKLAKKLLDKKLKSQEYWF